MVKILNIALYIIFVLIPALYFIWLLKHEHLIFKTFVVVMAILSTIGILLKFNFKPYNHIFTLFILVCQFLTMYIYILFICVYLYRFSFKFVKRRPYRFGNIVATMIAITLTISGFHSHYNKKEVIYHVTVPKTSSVSKLKICLVSDLHLSSGTYMRQARKLVKTVNDKHYDLVCFAGDVFDENTPDALMNRSLQEFMNMKSTYGTYWISGNHEYYGKHTDFTVFEKYNIHFLKNTYETVDNTFNIVGFTDKTSRDHYDINQVIKGMDTSLPTITVVPGADNQQISISGNSLNGITNIHVIAGDGSSSDYNITFNVLKSEVNTLSMININDSPIVVNGVDYTSSAAFNPNVFEYNITLPIGTRVMPEVTYSEGDEYQSVRMVETENGVEIYVVAQDTSFKNVYAYVSFAFSSL